MKRKIFSTLLILFIYINLHAQYEFSFSGYAVDLPTVNTTNETIANLFNIDKTQSLNLTRVRLRPTLNLWSGARLNMDYEISSIYTSGTSAFTLIPTNKTNRQYFDLTWNPVSEKNFNIIHFIDRLYFRQGFNWGNIEVGRQRISWGTGRIWNPTDLFNPINPATYYKLEKDGADVVSAMIYLGNFTDINFVYNPQKDPKKSNYGFRFRSNFDEYDFSFIGGYFDERIIAGMDFAGNLFDAGVRGEGIYAFNQNHTDKNFARFILGIDYQFTSKLYGLAEYQFNGEGTTNKFNYLNEFPRLLNGEIINLSRNYIFISAMYQLTPLLTVTLSDNTNLNDKSGFVGAVGNYSVTENFYVSAGAQVTYGENLSEYWYYPNSFYLQGEYYF